MTILTEQAARAVQLSDAELFTELGKRAYLQNDVLIMKRGAGSDDENGGRKVFEHLLPKLRKLICEDWKACEQADRYGDEVSLVVAISDTIITNKVAPLPAATLAVLVTRIGVKRFCACP
ncbi:MAG: hypothetical protein HOP09_04805 [Hyphomicrobium sp.]|nr:hypothetical protein [Hyphomicrobium sp.]